MYSLTTPWDAPLTPGSYMITMPARITVEGRSYVFKNWNDGTTDNPRTVELTTDVTFVAIYVPIRDRRRRLFSNFCANSYRWVRHVKF